jgi:hypothetical protein
MSGALIGFAGVLAGFIASSSYGFWAQRRSELAEALLAASILAAALRDDAATQHDTSAELAASWDEHRRGLVRHMPPDAFRLYADHWRNRLERTSSDGALLATTEALTGLFWGEHQAFILVPLWRWATGNSVSKRLRATVTDTLRPTRS